jgi:preprotein translocase subunit YajC
MLTLTAIMNTKVFFGLILALANIVLSLVGFFLGFQTDKIAQGQWYNLLPLVVFIVILWFGIRAVREEAKDKSLTYGKGVGAGFLISLYGGLIGSIYSFVHFTFINPNFADYQVDFVREKWVQKGLSDAQMEAVEKFTRVFLSPALMSITGLFMTLLLGVVVALILAAILKRAPVVVADQPEPPTVAAT